MDVLEIKHDNGEIRLKIHDFFPCDTKRLKILKELITDEYKQGLIQVLYDLKCLTEQHQTRLAKDYHIHYQDAKDLERRLEDGKHPNGVPIKEVERIQMTNELKDHIRRHKQLKKDFNAVNARVKKLQKNIEVLST